MNRLKILKLLFILPTAIALAGIPLSAGAQLSPDPNPVGNVISLGTSIGMNFDRPDPYYNYGEIDVASGGTLNNSGILNNVGTINSAGTLENLNLASTPATPYYLDIGVLNNSGVLVSSGTFLTNWQDTNSGTLTNLGTMTSENTEIFPEPHAIATLSIGLVTNTSAGTLVNAGTFTNYADLENAGALNNSGTLNNATDGQVISSLNNTGTLTNTATGTINNNGGWGLIDTVGIPAG